LIYFVETPDNNGTAGAPLQIAKVRSNQVGEFTVDDGDVQTVVVEDGLVALIDNLTPCHRHRVPRQNSDCIRWLVVFRIGQLAMNR
ncbi:MAG: hypothetical protein AAF556_12040, partial [Pseudomonadota bacterium]